MDKSFDSEDFSVGSDTGTRTLTLTPNSVSLIHEAMNLLAKKYREIDSDDDFMKIVEDLRNLFASDDEYSEAA
jgi:hypothetical protein